MLVLAPRRNIVWRKTDIETASALGSQRELETKADLFCRSFVMPRG
jgi:hypothetical protein